MGILHLVSRSPLESLALAHCLARVGRGDALLLLDNAVYAASKNTAAAGPLRAVPLDVTVYVLRPDLEARGLPVEGIPDDILSIDHDGFVELTERYPLCLSWF